MELRFSDDDLRRLAEQLAPLIAAQLHPPAASPAGWLDTKAAAVYAGCSVSSLHKATAALEVRFAQNADGGKAWFKHEWIDAWRNGQ